MLSSSAYVSLFLALASTAVAKQALQYNDNPTNVVAIADFPQGGKGKNKNIMGTMKFFSVNGTVKVHWDVTQLPPKRGPFYYKIYSKHVGKRGSCSSIGKTFNPFKGSSKCNVSGKDDSYCQVGDLSGKHGWINTTCFEASYYDPYLSLDPNDPSYVVGRSIAVLYPNKKKMACADIILSDESVSSADMESKRNIKHNKDLIENQIEGWEPTPEEAEMIDEAHKEWLKYNNEGDVHVDAENISEDEIDAAQEIDEDETVLLAQYVDDEDAQKPLSVEPSESQKVEKLKDNLIEETDETEEHEEGTEAEEVSEKLSEKVEERSNEDEPKESSSYEIPHTTDCENAAASEMSKYSLAGGVIGAVIGFLL